MVSMKGSSENVPDKKEIIEVLKKEDKSEENEKRD